MNASDVLKNLGIEPTNPGACGRGWITGKGTVLESINPTNGKAIAGVRQADSTTYEKVATAATRRSSRGGWSRADARNWCGRWKTS